jgi:hypothetical protein
MGTLVRLAPPPALRSDAGAEPLPSAAYGIRIDAAVNLLEAREYSGLGRDERLSKALAEQRAFVNQLLEPSLGLVDLRTRITPGSARPIEIALLGRIWRDDAARLDAYAIERRDQLLASIPRHLTASPIEDAEELTTWVEPLDASSESAMITRREILGLPQRPDAKVAYYFSVVPFNWADTDWTGVYATLGSSPVPLVLSVALLPVALPPEYGQLLSRYATFYARLAREDRLTGGLYHGERMLPPDAFAVDAHPAFEDYARRYQDRVFAMRIQVSARGPLPAGIVEVIASAISPGDTHSRHGDTRVTHLAGQRAASTYAVRRTTTDYDRALADWNLTSLDVALLDGPPDIWGRRDPPPLPLAALCVIGDARDASCAFRLPVAVDGTVPGFRVRRGSFGHEESYAASGPAITLGVVPGSGAGVSIELGDLTKHALVAGSTGSGKTTTVLELLRQLWVDHQVPFLVIEPVNSDADDYRRLLAEPGFQALRVITVGDESVCPMRFNPFETPENVLVAEHATNLLACFTAAFGLWEPLPSIYREALNIMYLDAGILTSERPDGSHRQWPTVVEFLRAMRKVTADLGYAGEVKHNIEAASLRRAEQMTMGVAASVFLTDRPNDISGLLDRPMVLELKSLGSGDEQALMIALLLNAITEHYQAVRGPSPRLEHLTVVEEAHRLLERPGGSSGQEQAQAKEKAAEGFANTLAENRKYGEGMLIAEQLPTKLVVDAVKNTNLKIMHRLTSEEDRRYLGETMGLDEAQSRFATRLVTGEALVYSDAMAEAAQVEVHRTLTAGEPASPRPHPQDPFAGCSACRARCAYRGAALAIVRHNPFVDEVQRQVKELQQADRAEAKREELWSALSSHLRERVRTLQALPSEDPGISDAAYCVFLHSLAIRRTHFAPGWANAVQLRLGIEPVERPTGGADE